jgi:hypothetical protein
MLFQILSDLDVFFQLFGKMALGKPLGFPRFGDLKS